MSAGLIEIGECVNRILKQDYSGRSNHSTDDDYSDDKISILCVGERTPSNRTEEENAVKLPYDIIRSIIIPFPPISTYTPGRFIDYAFMTDVSFQFCQGLFDRRIVHYGRKEGKKGADCFPSLALPTDDDRTFLINPERKIIWPYFAEGDFPLFRISRKDLNSVMKQWILNMPKFYAGKDAIINWFGYLEKKLSDEKCAHNIDDILSFLDDCCAALETVADLNFYAPHDSPGNGIFMDICMIKYPALLCEFVSEKSAAKIKRLHETITDIIVKPLYQVDVSNLHPVVELPEKLKSYKVDFNFRG